MHRPTDRIDEYIDLQDAIATLPTRQRRVVYLYSLGMTQMEIAEELEITQQGVSQLLENAVVSCKNMAENVLKD